MHAVILDIDGTLLDSNNVDSDLYAAAIESVLGQVRMREAWSDYDHITDSGILRDICADNGISNANEAMREIEREFVLRLHNHIDEYGPFPEIPGARDFVHRLAGASGFHVAYATGGWTASARLKLESAGFPLDGLPLATASDAIERREIMRTALGRLPGDVTQVTYYGDGRWDEVATASLGWKFVAVGARLSGIDNFRAHGPYQHHRST